MQAAIDILPPTPVISQGWGLVDTLRDPFGDLYEINLNIAKCYLADCDLNGNRFVWVALYHPTRNWSTINRTMFQKTVDPAVKEARKRALKLAQTV